jgi:hypothetical protein
VDEDGKLVFCTPGNPATLLWALSEWAKPASDRIPAAAAVIGSAAAAWSGSGVPDLATLLIRRYKYRSFRIVDSVRQPSGTRSVNAMDRNRK